MTNYYDEYDVTDESRYESMLVVLLLYPPALELELFSVIFKPVLTRSGLTKRWRSRVMWTARDNLRSILN